MHTTCRLLASATATASAAAPAAVTSLPLPRWVPLADSVCWGKTEQKEVGAGGCEDGIAEADVEVPDLFEDYLRLCRVPPHQRR